MEKNMRQRFSIKCLLCWCSVFVAFAVFTKFYVWTMLILEDRPEVPSWTKHEIPNFDFPPILSNETKIRDDESMSPDLRNKRISELRNDNLRKGCLDSGAIGDAKLFDFWTWKNDLESQQIKLPRLLVSDQHKVIFCSMEDSGDAQWEDIIVKMEEGEGKDYVDQRFVGGPKLRLLWNYRDNSIQYRMENYFKFMMVREPLTRLVNAYHGHLKPNGLEYVSDYYFQLSKEIRRTYDPKMAYTIRRSDDKNYARLNDFVSYLLDNGRAGTTPQLFQMYYDLCAPCNVHYDFIAREESMVEDSRYILEMVNAGKLHYPLQKTENLYAERIQELESVITLEQAKQLLEKYKLDYRLFGYPNPWETPQENIVTTS